MIILTIFIIAIVLSVVFGIVGGTVAGMIYLIAKFIELRRERKLKQ